MPLSPREIKKIVRLALSEDAARQDMTTQILISPSTLCMGRIIAKQDLVFCGTPLAREVFKTLNAKIKFKIGYRDGAFVKRGRTLIQLSGPARALLSGERVALNLLQHLSGISTLTRKYVDQVRGTRAKILDTRKTTPGLRALERYAVQIGGGVNHRFDLKSAVMVKDNHRALHDSISTLLGKLKKWGPKVPVIFEVDTLGQFREALQGGAKYIQLDNMGVTQLKKAVSLARGKAKLEATGGVSLKNVRSIAKTGVDFISVGALTHSAPAVDISLEVIK